MYIDYSYDADNKDLNRYFNVLNYNYDFRHDKYMFQSADNEDIVRTFTAIDDDWGERRLELDAIYGRTEKYSANEFFYDETGDKYVHDLNK